MGNIRTADQVFAIMIQDQKNLGFSTDVYSRVDKHASDFIERNERFHN